MKQTTPSEWRCLLEEERSGPEVILLRSALLATSACSMLIVRWARLESLLSEAILGLLGTIRLRANHAPKLKGDLQQFSRCSMRVARNDGGWLRRATTQDLDST